MTDNRLGGYVRLYRKILDNPAFRDAGEAMFFAYLVLLANWKAGERRYDDRLYRLDRGEFVIGERKLAETFGWSRQKVRGLLSRWGAAEMLTRKSAQHGDQRAPVISICNYGIYQASVDDVEPTPEPRTAQGRPKDGPPKKEGKEGNSYTVDFESFWRVYPGRKPHSNPKKTARQKFELALKRGVPAADIIRGAGHYATHVERDHVEPKFTAQAATWISQERWTEYQEPPRESRPADDGFL